MKCGGENFLLLMTAMLCGIGLYATPDGVAAQMFDPPPLEARECATGALRAVCVESTAKATAALLPRNESIEIPRDRCRGGDVVLS